MRTLSKFALTATLALITSSGVEISPVVAGVGDGGKAMQMLDGMNPASFEPEPNKPPSRTGGTGTR
jgi:hypothetical protein